MKTIKITFDKQRQFLFWMPVITIFLVLLIFASFTYTLITLGEVFDIDFLPLRLGILSFFGIMLFSIVVSFFINLSLLISMLTSRPIFLLDDQGITNPYGYMFNPTFIAWNEIASIKSVQAASGEGYIYIELKNPDDFIAKQPFFIRRRLRFNKRYFDSTVVIATQLLEGHFQPVVDIITNAWLTNR